MFILSSLSPTSGNDHVVQEALSKRVAVVAKADAPVVVVVVHSSRRRGLARHSRNTDNRPSPISSWQSRTPEVCYGRIPAGIHVRITIGCGACEPGACAFELTVSLPVELSAGVGSGPLQKYGRCVWITPFSARGVGASSPSRNGISVHAAAAGTDRHRSAGAGGP